jgi:hypothetical protein
MNFEFTPDQALHAQQVAMKLWRSRYLLPKGVGFGNTLKYLPEDVFGALYRQNDRLVTIYRDTAHNTSQFLRERERDLWLTPPTIPRDKVLVDCNLYGSGLDIMAIVPVSSLMFQLANPDQKLFKEHYPDSASGDMTLNSIRALEKNFTDYDFRLSEDLSQYVKDTPKRDKVLVVLSTRFEPSSVDDDFMQGKLDGLVTYPYLASWLLYKNAQRDIRLSNTGFTIFNSSRSGHITLDLSGTKPCLQPNKEHGYECKVSFATIL